MTDAVRARHEAEAAQAWSLARTARDGGELAAARFWFERACRLAPDDPRISLELALLLAAKGDDDALPILANLLARHDIASGWIALASLHRRHRRIPDAAAALGRMLARMELPGAPDFAAFAQDVAARAGFPGWCGIGPGRTLRAAATGPVTARHDGKPFPPGELPLAGHLDLAVAGKALLGSPIDLARITRTEGIVSEEQGGLAGWATRPAAPETPPALILQDSTGRRLRIKADQPLAPAPEAPFCERHGFVIPPARLRRLTPPFTILGADQRPLYGCPAGPTADLPAIPAGFTGPAPPALPAKAPLAVIMPVYRDAALTAATLDSLFQALPADEGTIIVIDDASPEPPLRALLARHAKSGRIRRLRHRVNRGFPAAANTGIKAARRRLGPCDILLLNADTLVPPGAPARLHAALYARAEVGSVTPLSNEATILSYPRPGGNPAPDLAATAALDRLAAKANGNRLIEIPTAIGFCMAIRHDCLAATGMFREDIFAQGYGEENDWCLRARHRGWRHFALPSCFVAHRGGASFGAAGKALARRNIGLINRLHPGYDALIAGHLAKDPLFPARRRLDAARFAANRRTRAVLLVSHDHGGGVARVVAARMAALRASGTRPILLQPDFTGSENGIGAARLTDGAPDAYPNLRFAMPAGFSALLRTLRRESIEEVEFHHALGHHPLIRTLADALKLPARHVIHDYASFCKRINLIGDQRRYCGEPDLAACTACIARNGSETTDPLPPQALHARSAAEFAAAARIDTPSADAANRLLRHFPGISVTVTPWEDDPAPMSLVAPPKPPAPRLIAVIGGIGPAKGYDILLDCARDAAARSLPLRFVLIGVSEHDAPLIETGRVMITGPYQEGEAAALIRSTSAHLAFLPSVWPETWCFTLTEAWRAGLYALGFDIGAQGQRIRATGRGAVLPLGLPAARLNQILLAWRMDFSDCNLQMHSARASHPVPAEG